MAKITPNKLKVIAAIQARLGSTRLPGKVLKKIAGKTMVERIFERLKTCQELDEVALAIPDNKGNALLTEYAKKAGIPYCRGSEKDLIARHYKTAKYFRADALVRITADCPLVEPAIVDAMVGIFRQHPDKFDFLTNNRVNSFPHGLEIEIFPIKTLEWLDREVKNPLHREWLSCYIFEQPKKFRIYNFKSKANLSEQRWTIDYPEDLKFVREIFKALGRHNRIFHMDEVVRFLKDNPHVAAINAIRKEKAVIGGVRSREYYQLKNKIGHARLLSKLSF